MEYTAEQIKAAAELFALGDYGLTLDCKTAFAKRILTLESENADLKKQLAESEKREKVANETIQLMAHDMVCFGCIDNWLCDDIPQEIHLKYQPKNDGKYANEPCYKCIEEYYRRGVQAEKE